MTEEMIRNQENIFPLTNLNEQLLAFMRIANAMLEARDLDEILSAITRQVSRIIDFDRSSISFISPDGKSLVLRNIHKATTERENIGEGREIAMDESTVIGWVAIHREPLKRDDINDYKEFHEVVHEEPLKSDMVVPLVARDKLYGTLNVGSYSPDAFSETDLEVLVNCGKFASLAIEHTVLRLEAQDLGHRYKTLQENANDIIMLIDKNTGRLCEVNRKSEAVFGYSRYELLKKSYFDLFAQEDQYQARRDFINILSQKSKSLVDRRMINKNGDFIFVDVNSNMINIKGDVFIQMIVHNVSQRKMLEQQIIHQNKNLQEVNKKLRDMDKMKTEFLGNISHELRTPLSIIIAYSESLRDSSLSAEERLQFLDVIGENGESLLALINNLLDLSKLEISGKMLSMSLSHISDVINSIWPQMKKLADSKNIQLSFHPGINVPVIYFDNNQLVQVFAGLIQNAIKFTESGGFVEVKTSMKAKEVWVQVIDNGVGIRPEQREQAFDIFRQIDGSSSRRWGGLGIGLALAKHIVQLHGGKIRVESEQGKGSTFTVVLPADTEEVFLEETSGEMDLWRGDVDEPKT
jgi:PAS domain S-box-containing protein